MLYWLGCKPGKAGRCGSLRGAEKGSIPLARSRSKYKSPVITDGAFSFLRVCRGDRAAVIHLTALQKPSPTHLFAAAT